MTACPFCANRIYDGYPRFPATPCVPCNVAYARDLRDLADRQHAIDRQWRRLSWVATHWPTEAPAIRAAVKRVWQDETPTRPQPQPDEVCDAVDDRDGRQILARDREHA